MEEDAGLNLNANGADAFIRDMDRAAKAVDAFGDAGDKGGKGVEGFGKDAAGAQKGVAGLGKESEQSAKGVNDLGTNAKDSGGKLQALGNIAKGIAAGGFAILAAGVAGVVSGLMRASERTAEFRRVMGQDFPVETINAISSDVALLERRFGADLPQAMDAARQLVANGLAPDFDAAMDILAAGFGEGLDVGEDFLDTFREYSPILAGLGFTGDEALSLINRGLDAGARNADIVADAVKEFGILIREPATLEAVNALDSGIGDIVTSFQDGKIAGDEALSLITDRLAAIEDPILRNQLGVQLFGTKWEDMGEKAIFALGQTDEGLITSSGAMDEASSKITSFGEILPRIGDLLGTAFAPMAESLLGFVNGVWPSVEAAITTGITIAGNFASALGGSSDAAAALPEPLQAVVAAIQGVGEAGNTAKGALEAFAASPWGQEIQQGAGVVSAYFSGPWQQDLQNGIAIVQSGLETLGNSPFGQRLQAGAAVAANYFANDFAQDFQNGAAIVGGKLEELAALPVWGQIREGAADVAGYILNEWPGDFTAGVQLVVDAITGLPGTISGFVEDFTSGAQDLGQAIVDGIAAGIEGGVSAIVSAAQSAAQSALDAAMAWLGIESPSRVFAEDVGEPISEGVARGIMDNLGVLQDAAQQMGWAVLEEAQAFASTIESAINPLLQASFGGVAGFARQQIDALDALADLEPDTRSLDRISAEIEDITAEIRELEAETPGEERRPSREAQQLAGNEERLAELATRRAALENTAANNVFEDTRRAAAEELAQILADEAELRAEQARLAEEVAAQEAAAATEAAIAEAERLRRIGELIDERAALGQQYDREAERLAALQTIHDQTQDAIAEAQRESLRIEDPAERAAYFETRMRQILELADLDARAASASTDAERARLEEQRALLEEAHQAEFSLYQQQALERRSAMEGMLRDAADALEQLDDLIYYTQQDVMGIGSEAMRGIAEGVRSSIGMLRDTLGDALDDVLAEARRRLGIQSPSTVFAEMIGAPLALGIGAGFEQQIIETVQPRLVAQVQALVRPVAAAATITSSQTTNISYAVDARGAAPGVGREVRGALSTQAQTARADLRRRSR